MSDRVKAAVSISVAIVLVTASSVAYMHTPALAAKITGAMVLGSVLVGCFAGGNLGGIYQWIKTKKRN